jgi:phage/plasmid-associated DNA primase
MPHYDGLTDAISKVGRFLPGYPDKPWQDRLTWDEATSLHELPDYWLPALIPIRDKSCPYDIAAGTSVGWPTWLPSPLPQLHWANGVSIRPGRRAGLIVLDADAAEGELHGCEDIFQDRFGRSLSDLPPTASWTSGKPGRLNRAFRVRPDQYEALDKCAQFIDMQGRLSKVELRWNGHSGIIGAHTVDRWGELVRSYSWVSHPKDGVAYLPDWVLAAWPREREDPFHPPLDLTPAEGWQDGPKVPLLELVSPRTRDTLTKGDVQGNMNDSQLRFTLDLAGTSLWLQSQGYCPEPTAEELYETYLDLCPQERLDRDKARARLSGAWERASGPFCTTSEVRHLLRQLLPPEEIDLERQYADAKEALRLFRASAPKKEAILDSIDANIKAKSVIFSNRGAKEIIEKHLDMIAHYLLAEYDDYHFAIFAKDITHNIKVYTKCPVKWLDALMDIALKKYSTRKDALIADIKAIHKLLKASEADEAGDAPDPYLLDGRGADWLPSALALGLRLGDPDRPWLCIRGLLHQWDETHFKPVSDEQAMSRVGAVLSLMRYERFDSQGALIGVYHPWEKPDNAKSAVQQAKILLGVTEDSDPANGLNFSNGSVLWTWEGNNLKLEVKPHSPDSKFTYCLDYPYEPDADSSHWHEVLKAIEPSDQDRLQRCLGSALDLPKFLSSQGRPRGLLLVGSGSNGKDTLGAIMRKVLGSRGFTSVTLSDFRQYENGTPFNVGPLLGSRLNWPSESTQFIQLDQCQVIKSVISCEEINYRAMHAMPTPFIPNALMIFNANDPPRIDLRNVSTSSRWHVMKLEKTFLPDPDPEDPNQLPVNPAFKYDPDYIRDNICSAAFLWMLEGMMLAVRDGIDYSSGEAAMREVRRQSCHLFDFCDDAGIYEDPESEVPLKQIYDLLQRWYETEGMITKAGAFSGERKIVAENPHSKLITRPRDLYDRLLTVFPKLKKQRDSRGWFQLVGLQVRG